MMAYGVANASSVGMTWRPGVGRRHRTVGVEQRNGVTSSVGVENDVVGGVWRQRVAGVREVTYAPGRRRRVRHQGHHAHALRTPAHARRIMK